MSKQQIRKQAIEDFVKYCKRRFKMGIYLSTTIKEFESGAKDFIERWF